MRDDMYKVIVERPRRGGITTHGSRRYRNQEDRPTKLGMRRGHASRKWLNENLAPLKRWLAAQAGRPWDGVYSDLCANIDRRNTVQAHIFAHIDGFVERHTLYADARVWTRQYGRARSCAYRTATPTPGADPDGAAAQARRDLVPGGPCRDSCTLRRTRFERIGDASRRFVGAGCRAESTRRPQPEGSIDRGFVVRKIAGLCEIEASAVEGRTQAAWPLQ